MLLRTLLMMITSRRKPRKDFREVGHVTMRVMPNDLDLLGHVNNGIYLSLMDLGRMDLMIRTGKWQELGRVGWYPVAASVTVTYRRSLRLWEKYVLETKLIGFDDKAMYIEQRFVRDNEVYVNAIMRARFLKRTGGTVTVAELGALAGIDPSTMPIPEWMATWAKDAALPPAKASFASDWA
ncbi:MAG TPA: thioesterase family protein [Galbitalea sp.]|nr:thioesterase family protein [Galbitalea sp.]